MQRVLAIIVLVLTALVACRPQADENPSVLDEDPAVMRELAAVQTSRALTATPPTAIPPTLTLRPSSTPPTVFPTRVVPSATPELLAFSAAIQESVELGPWRTSFFTNLDGQRQTFADFEGQFVIVQTFSLDCDVCFEQTEDLVVAAQRLLASSKTDDVVFLQLSINALDTLDAIADYQTSNNLPPDDSLMWQGGVASQQLLRDIRDEFGFEFIDGSGGGVFFIDRSGFGHVAGTGTLSPILIEEILVGFDPLGVTEEAPTPNPNATPTDT